jgi:hypothetical protein
MALSSLFPPRMSSGSLASWPTNESAVPSCVSNSSRGQVKTRFTFCFPDHLARAASFHRSLSFNAADANNESCYCPTHARGTASFQGKSLGGGGFDRGPWRRELLHDPVTAGSGWSRRSLGEQPGFASTLEVLLLVGCVRSAARRFLCCLLQKVGRLRGLREAQGADGKSHSLVCSVHFGVGAHRGAIRALALN